MRGPSRRPVALFVLAVLGLLGLGVAGSATAGAEAKRKSPSCRSAKLLGVKKIWDRGEHNAFTDLIRFKDRWWCTFREAGGHVQGDGEIRVIASKDGATWSSTALLSEKGIDLRDPKISIMPDGRLMIVAGGSVYRGGKLVGRQPRVTFSQDGHAWGPTQRVLSEGEWLWRVTWHEGKGYGVSYNKADYQSGKRRWSQMLFVTTDGLTYEKVCDFKVDGFAGETTLRFTDDDTMIAMVRRESGNKHGWIGRSKRPYTEWTWHETDYHFGGPNFIILPDGSMWAGSRYYPGGAKTVLARFGPQTYEPILTLPSGGDTSYPGLVWHDGVLWMSYYASHEKKTSIYLARIELIR